MKKIHADVIRKELSAKLLFFFLMWHRKKSVSIIYVFPPFSKTRKPFKALDNTELQIFTGLSVNCLLQSKSCLQTLLTESHDHFSWKRPLKSSSSTVHPVLPGHR